LTAFVWFFFSVGGVIVLVLGIALWVNARPRSAAARRALLAVAIVYAAISIYGISYGAGRLLTMGFHPLMASDVPPGRSVIVLLGSGSYTSWDWDRRQFSMVDRPSANRVYEALRVFNLAGADLIISSGGLIDPDDDEEPNGLTMRDELVRLGVPPSKIVVETQSRNTHDEAVIVADMLRSMQIEHVILVTSDMHMRRSLGAFRSEGIRAIPAIAPHVAADDPWFVPSDDGLHEAAIVAHEAIGLAYYAVRGWYRW
jgi:uncharacterized SAM-binding protein YcdF (DUF218 family)